jgi:hypothetical protein
MGQAGPLNRRRSEELRRRVAESERLVAGWRELIAQMRTDGRDVAVACDILQRFEKDLEDRRSEVRRG